MRAAAVMFTAALAVPAIAAAQALPAPNPIVVELARVCIGANGDPAEAGRRALAGGYSPTPASLLPNIRDLEGATGFLKSSEATLNMVVIAETSRRLGGERVTMNLCGVAVSPADHRALRRDLETVLGQEPMRGENDLFAWVQDAAGRRPILALDDRRALELIKAGGVRVVGIQRNGDLSMLIYLVPQTD